MERFFALIVPAALFAVALSPKFGVPDESRLRMSATTGAENSGLLKVHRAAY
jgi:ABC-type tungstate transport system permease subunit